jgi:hypothetical protein
MSVTPHNDQPFAGQARSGHDLGAELLPFPSESPSDYLARLKALHARVGALIDAIEMRRPVLGPQPTAPALAQRGGDRREPAGGERRTTAVGDRRVGLPDERPVPVNRRFGSRDRRRMPVERRQEYSDPRRDPRPVPWEGRFRLDGTAAMWALQVVAWTAVVATALIFGIGR